MFASLTTAITLYMFSYPWPLAPMTQQHDVSGTFCEFREGPPPHFHSGVDIPAVEGTPVYAVASGSVLWLGSGTNGGIRVGRFAYVHVVPRADLEIGDYVQKGELVGYINPLNHVHFKDGGGASGYVNRNPLIPPGLEPFGDPYPPQIYQVSFYTDGLGSPIDPQHLSGLVDVVALAMDTTDYSPWGTNNGVYQIGFALYQGDSEVIAPHIRFQFDTKPDNTYTLNVYAPWSTNGSHYYIVTNQLETNDALNFQLLGEGDYTLVIFAFDTEGNADTVSLSIHAEPPDVEPPDPPFPLRLLPLPDGRAQFEWRRSQAPDIARYKVFLRFNDAPWTLWATLGPEDSLYVTQYPMPPGWNFAFRILAEDWAIPPNQTDTSNAFVIRRGYSTNLLLVDGTSFSSEATLYWRLLEGVSSGNILTDAAGVPHDSTADWLLLSWGRSGTGFQETEWAAVYQILSRGHKVVLSGSSIAATLSENPQDSVRMDTLIGGVGTKAVGTPPIPVQGLSGTLFEGWSAWLDEGTHGAYPVDTISVLTVTQNDAQPVLEFPGLGIAGVQTPSTLVLGFPWEALYPDSARETFLRILAEWAQVNVEEQRPLNEGPSPDLRVLYLPYGRIQLQPLQGKVLDLQIFDIAGRRVYTMRLSKKQVLPKFPEGIYFLRWQSGHEWKTRKLWMVR